MILLLICTLMWSISGVLIKQIPWNAAVIAGFRSLIAGGVMALYIKITGLAFRIDAIAVRSGVLMGAMFLSFTLANKLTTAANAIVIQSSAPVFVLLYQAVVRKQRISRIDWIAVLLTLAGISLFFFDQLSPGLLLGNLIALLAGILLAGTYIVTCGAPKQSCMNGILLAHGLTAVVGILFAFVFPPQLDGSSMLRVLLLGVVQLGIPYVLYGIAVQHCPPLAASLLGITEAVFNPLWVFLATGEAPSAMALVGAALVLCSIAGWVLLKQRFAARNVGYTTE